MLMSKNVNNDFSKDLPIVTMDLIFFMRWGKVAWFSDGPGRSRLRTLSLPRLMDFIQGHVRDVVTPLFFGSQ